MNLLKQWTTALCLSFVIIAAAAAQEDAHGDESPGRAVTLSAQERDQAGIRTSIVSRKTLNETVLVPAEVVINAYRSARVTPRITAQVAARHVRLGDAVETGQLLVTLSSVDMAEAQGALIVANREWQRVESLGRNAVSERRHTEAQVAQQQAYARVIAFGMTAAQADALQSGNDASQATGDFDLLSPQAGTVLRDDFIVGELIEPGRVLFDISDESVMWVEAQTGPTTLDQVENGARARVSVDGKTWINATVLERRHQLDETTRTQGLRIEVDNADDLLHAGQFVQAEIVTGSRKPVLVVPARAVTLVDGMPTVFSLEGNDALHATTIQTGATIGDWLVVRGGLEAGDTIAVDGVFHVKSLLLKSSLGGGHGH